MQQLRHHFGPFLADLSPTPSLPRPGMRSTSHPCLLNAAWCLQSDVSTVSRSSGLHVLVKTGAIGLVEVVREHDGGFGRVIDQPNLQVRVLCMRCACIEPVLCLCCACACACACAWVGMRRPAYLQVMTFIVSPTVPPRIVPLPEHPSCRAKLRSWSQSRDRRYATNAPIPTLMQTTMLNQAHSDAPTSLMVGVVPPSAAPALPPNPGSQWA